MLRTVSVYITYSILVLAFFLQGCVSKIAANMKANSREQTLQIVRAKGSVLKEYSVGNDLFMITKEAGSLYVKYRIYDVQVTGGGTNAEVMYSYDSNTNICFAASVQVDCKSVKKDPDMKNYIR